MKVSGCVCNLVDGNKLKGILVWLSKGIYRWTQDYVCGWTDSKKRTKL
jgi:hypothetical protein